MYKCHNSGGYGFVLNSSAISNKGQKRSIFCCNAINLTKLTGNINCFLLTHVILVL